LTPWRGGADGGASGRAGAARQTSLNVTVLGGPTPTPEAAQLPGIDRTAPRRAVDLCCHPSVERRRTGRSLQRSNFDGRIGWLWNLVSRRVESKDATRPPMGPRAGWNHRGSVPGEHVGYGAGGDLDFAHRGELVRTGEGDGVERGDVTCGREERQLGAGGIEANVLN
jgi:hypothetical protein